jgi:phosphatidylinositol 3-kinase
MPLVTENPEMKLIFDPEWNMDNLVEGKHHKLTFTPNRKGTKRNIEPSAKHKLMLQQVINYPPLHPLSNKEKHLVWTYRYHLSQDGRALPKFLKSVRWGTRQENKDEVEEALELLQQWHPMDAGEALELLNAEFSGDKTHPAIRQYAVSQLQKVDNEELQFYLLQLVQAIRYDSPAAIKEFTAEEEDGYLQLFVDDTHYNAPESRIIAQQLADAMDEGSLAKQQSFTQSEELLMEKILESDSEDEDMGQFEDIDMSSSAGSSTVSGKQYSTLAAFLVERACSSTRLSNYFYWYLSIECEENKERYIRVRRKFLENLCSSVKPKWRARYYMLKEQQNFISKILELRSRVMNSGGDREKKIEVLRKLVSSEEWQHFPVPVRLPLDPTQVIVGLDPEWATVYKSKLNPIGLTFKTITGRKYRVILKHGDDLRQDQLILQLLALMDGLLKKEKLDLKLSPYKVLACSSSPYGFVEYVDSTVGVADVLSKYKSIQNFFLKMSPNSMGSEVHPEVMDTYVRSCGESVHAYIRVYCMCV